MTQTHNNLPEPSQLDVMELLPQRPPFVMVGTLTHVDGRLTATRTTVTDDCILCDGTRLSPSGIIENMAQTCAARIGYVNKYVLNRGIQLGFIGAIRNLTIEALPAVGDTIVTEVEAVEEIFGMTLAEARVTVGDRVIATATLKIALRDEEPATATK